MWVQGSEQASSSKQASSSRTTQDTEQELHACTSCQSYHYIQKCIYTLTWKGWLEYHQEHMPSEPVPDHVRVKGGELINLRERIHELDDPASDYRHIEVHNTRLKPDLMPESSKNMLLAEQKKLADAETTDRRRRRQAEFAKEIEQSGAVDQGSEDELA